MTILTIAALVRETRVYAAMHPRDFGWVQISAMTDDHIIEIIKDHNCCSVLETIAAMQNVAQAFNED